MEAEHCVSNLNSIIEVCKVVNVRIKYTCFYKISDFQDNQNKSNNSYHNVIIFCIRLKERTQRTHIGSNSAINLGGIHLQL